MHLEEEKKAKNFIKMFEFFNFSQNVKTYLVFGSIELISNNSLHSNGYNDETNR